MSELAPGNDGTFTYTCVNCGETKPDSEFENTGASEVCLECESKMSDALKLTHKLIKAGANRSKVIAIVDGYGDAIDWSYHSLDSIVGEVWQSDINSGDAAEHWIINEICRNFNVTEVTE